MLEITSWKINLSKRYIDYGKNLNILKKIDFFNASLIFSPKYNFFSFRLCFGFSFLFFMELINLLCGTYQWDILLRLIKISIKGSHVRTRIQFSRLCFIHLFLRELHVWGDVFRKCTNLNILRKFELKDHWPGWNRIENSILFSVKEG